ncbi:MAG: hypothetical protein KF696_15300 [Planctomycetes bacterium]|nr:hypothetical protein [Planctomycetota bacterium]MCW8136038.1 hypothetical protein [Planctomycetota bacterium]
MNFRRSSAPVIAFILLLVLVLGGLGWLISRQKQPRVNQPDIADEGEPEPGPAPLPRNNQAPEPAPQPQPEPPLVSSFEPAVLPPHTRFRARVLEADAALSLATPPEAGSKEAWYAYSTLEQLQSRFAPHARLLFEGRHADAAAFEAEVNAAFLKPDVASRAFQRDKARRVELWLHNNARLPGTERLAPPGVNIPLNRRLQEHVDTAALASWLEAMESEFGATSYGDALPLDIVVFANPDAYLDFTRKRLRLEVPSWSAGMYSTSWQVVALPVAGNVSLAEVARHEMFHALQADLAPESLLVPWFAEGTAEWLDKAPPMGALRTHAEFSGAAWGYLGVLVERGFTVNLPEFLQLELAAFYASPEMNYLLAYLWVDFARTEDDLLPLYREFWELLKRGTDRAQAYARTFGGLNFDAITARFLARARKAPRNTVAPGFSHDAPEAALGSVPPELSGTPAPPAAQGEVSAGWFAALAELQRRGIDSSRTAYFKGEFDLIIVAIDSSESMARRIEEDWFDWDGFSRWLFALRYAGTLAFTRKGQDGMEEVPPEVLMSLVEAVLTDKQAEFMDATGVKVSEQIIKDIKDGYKNFDLQPGALKNMRRRELCRHTAESITWYWGTRQDRAKVVVVDYNINAVTEKDESAFQSQGFKSSASPIAKLFSKTAGNVAPGGSDGTDCDWWIGLTGITSAAVGEKSQRVACLFFTDSMNCAGAYGHPESNLGSETYNRDQQSMADAFVLKWREAYLDSTTSVLQLITLPGGENKGLQYVREKVTEAKLDNWAERFRK